MPPIRPSSLLPPVVLALALLSPIAGCEPGGKETGSYPGEADTAPGFDTVDTSGGVPDGSTPDAAPDTPSSLDDGAPIDDGSLPDGAAEVLDDAAADSGPADTTPVELVPDNDPPTIVAHKPGAAEEGVGTPFVVEVTFDEPVFEGTVQAQSFQVLNSDSQELPGERTLSADGATIVFTPTGSSFDPASPYTVRVCGVGEYLAISDLAGNKLASTYEFTFYTAGYEGTEGYAVLAATYAPTLHILTDDEQPQAHIPTTFDADGDWDGSNNKTWIQYDAKTIDPAVYFDVIETRSHYFIHYLYLFPWVNHPYSGYEHANGTPGAMVTVAKGAAGAPERPIAVTLYYKEKQAEENDAFVTTESGLVPAGGPSPSFFGIKAVYPQAQLFPGGHYDAYISAAEHESCLWLNTGESTHCKLTNLDRQGAPRFVLRYYQGVPTSLVYKFGWPADMDHMPGAPQSLDYALVPLETTLWPRRLQVGAHEIYGATYNYEAAASKVGAGLQLPSRFTDEVSEMDLAYGRPPWAWDFNPSYGTGFATVEQGWMGVDPASYFWARHADLEGKSGLVPFDVETGMGFALQYCFNPYAQIDFRGYDPYCTTKGP